MHPHIALESTEPDALGLPHEIQVDSATGAATLRVPVRLTEARGLSPALALSYSASSGNSAFGLGWSLSGAAAISRKGRRGVPRYDASDVFLLDGDELVPALELVNGMWQLRSEARGEFVVRYYRARRAGPAVRVEQWVHVASGRIHWGSRDAHNTLTLYGAKPDEASRICDPRDDRRVVMWLADGQYDDRGNAIEYEYTPENADRIDLGLLAERRRVRADRKFAQRYLKRIRYGNRQPLAAGVELQDNTWLFEVVLDYGDHSEPLTPSPQPDRTWLARADAFSNCRPGFELRTYRLCRRILLFHHVDALGPGATLVAATRLDHDENAAGATLRAIEVTGYRRDLAAITHRSLPPLRLTYSPATLGTAFLAAPSESAENVPHGLTGPRYRWVDLYGEGVPGILCEYDRGWYYKSNEGAGHFGPQHPVLERPSARTAQYALTDFDHDGNTDAVSYRGRHAGFFAFDTDRDSWDGFRSFPAVPHMEAAGAHAQWMDVDGDGRSDLILASRDKLTWFPAEGKDGFGDAIEVSAVAVGNGGGAPIVAENPQLHFHFADMNGDGLVDLVNVRNGCVEYWPQLGNGHFGESIVMDAPPMVSGGSEIDPRRLRLVDLDGTSAADIVYLGPRDVQVWRNAAGNRFLEGERLAYLPYVDDLSTVRVLDYLGNGSECLVWSSPLPGRAAPIQYLPLNPALRPRLLVSVDNSMGHEIQLSYTSSAAHYLRDKAAGRPWVWRTPAHRIVADRMESIDRVAGNHAVTRYEYHDAIYDRDEGTVIGFGHVDVYDSPAHADSAIDDAATPPKCVRTWRHPGRLHANQSILADAYAKDPLLPMLPQHRLEDVGPLVSEHDAALRALAGEIVREEVYAVDSAGRRADHPLSVTQSCYVARRLQPEQEADDAVFDFHLGERLAHIYEEQSDDPRAAHHLTLSVDPYGNALLDVSVAYARRAAHPAATPAQQRTRVVAHRQRWVNVDTPDRYEIGIPVESEDFEIANLPADEQALFDPDVLHADVSTALVSPFPHHATMASEGIQARRGEWERYHYWNDDRSAAAPLGTVGARTFLHHEEAACFTSDLIADVFGPRVHDGLLQACGYVASDGLWWQREPVHHFAGAAAFFAIERLERVDGGTTRFAYDEPYWLRAVEIEDARGNRTSAVVDYHVVVPWRVVEPGGQTEEALYDPLGVAIASTWYGVVRGEGDAPATYGNLPVSAYQTQTASGFDAVLADPLRFLQGLQQFVCYELEAGPSNPPRSIALERIDLVHDGEGGGQAGGSVQVTVTYRDGFGRPLQDRVRVGAGPAIQRDAQGRVIVDETGSPVLVTSTDRWRVSEHVEYDAKQLGVRRYPPHYSTGAAFEPEVLAAPAGPATESRFDPLARLREERFANGTRRRTDFGPWEIRHHDPNDTIAGSAYEAARVLLPAGHDEKRSLEKAQAHAGTPLVVHLDPDGQEVRQVHLAGGGAERITESTLDVFGNIAAIVDPRGLTAMRYRRDMQGRVLLTQSVDAGDSWSLPDAYDRLAHEWDSRGIHQHRTFDDLDRLVTVDVDAGGAPVRTETFVYGDDPTVGDGVLRNARGRMALHRDPAGIVDVLAYTPGGQILRSVRRVRLDHRAQPDWSDPAAVALRDTAYTSVTRYDALDRVTRQILPDGTQRTFQHDASGTVSAVRVSTTDGAITDLEVLSAIEVNARGQTSRTVLGNGVEIETTFNAATFRADRVTARLPLPEGEVRTLQDLRYTYDPMGNITHVVDEAQQPAHPMPLMQGLAVSSHAEYTYDAFYQLVEATGRVHQSLLEHDYRPGLTHPGKLKGTRHLALTNGAAVERYTRRYEYDAAGNLKKIRHDGATQSWTTTMWTSPKSNRSLLAQDPGGLPVADPESHFDAAGQCARLPHLRALDWNGAGALTRIVIVDRSGEGLPDDAEYYGYAGDGHRVFKVAERLVSGQIEITEKIYLDGGEIKRVRRGDDVLLERITSHVGYAHIHRWSKDDLARETGDTSQASIRYRLTNHASTTVLEINRLGRVVSYEEFFPFGGTAFIASAVERDANVKDYRFSGKEHDELTGFYYFGQRYYAPWMARWLSPDPIGPEDALNLYLFVHNNPVNDEDADGLEGKAQRGQISYGQAWGQPGTPIPDAEGKTRPRPPPGYAAIYIPGKETVEIVTIEEFHKRAKQAAAGGVNVLVIDEGTAEPEPTDAIVEPDLPADVQGLLESVRSLPGEGGDEKPSPWSSPEGGSDAPAGTSELGLTIGARGSPWEGSQIGPGGAGQTGGGPGPGGGKQQRGKSLQSGAGFGAGGGGENLGAGSSKGRGIGPGPSPTGKGGGTVGAGGSAERSGPRPGSPRGTSPTPSGGGPTGTRPSCGDGPGGSDPGVGAGGLGDGGTGGHADRISEFGGLSDGAGDGADLGAAPGGLPLEGADPSGDVPVTAESATGHEGRGGTGDGENRAPSGPREESSGLDVATQIAGYANLAFDGEPEGTVGGLPGAWGSRKPGTVAKILYLGFTALTLLPVGVVLKGAGAGIRGAIAAFRAGGARALLRFVAGGFRATLPAARALVRRLGGFGRDVVRLFRPGWLGHAGRNLGRFFVASSTRTFQTSRQFFGRWRGLFGRNTGKWGWTLEHSWIKQRWYRGTNPVFAPGTAANRWAQRLGDAGWNLIPMPRWLNSKMFHYPVASTCLNATVYTGSVAMPYLSWSEAADQWKALQEERNRSREPATQ